MLSAKPWKLEGFLRLMAGIFVCLSVFTLLQAAVQHFVGPEKFEDGSLLFLVFTSLMLHGSILIATGIFLLWHRVTWSEAFGFSIPPVASAILLGLLAALIFLPVGMILQEISVRVLTYLHFETPPQMAIEEFNKTDSPISRAYLAVFAIFIAPFAEEVFFRGILYTAFRQIGRPRFALWSSAIIFAAIHHSAPIFIPLLVLGVVLAWVYERTNNLLASITTHAVFNAVNVLFLFVGDRLETLLRDFLHLSS